MLMHRHPDITETDEIEVSRDISFFEQDLARLKVNKSQSAPEKVNNLGILLARRSRKEFRIPQRQV